MTTTVTIRNSQIVRNAMKQFTLSQLWTNKLVNGNRTVKCYGSSKKMRKSIANALNNAGISRYEIRRGAKSFYADNRSTIVEIPCNW